MELAGVYYTLEKSYEVDAGDLRLRKYFHNPKLGHTQQNQVKKSAILRELLLAH